MAAADLWLEPGEDPQRAASLNMKAGELDRWEGHERGTNKATSTVLSKFVANTARKVPFTGWMAEVRSS